MRLRPLAVVVLLPVLAILTGACEGGNLAKDSSRYASQTTTVKVAHVPSTLFAPLYVAQDKGYFKDRGLDVELRKVQAGQEAVPLAGSGKVDAVVAGFSAGLFNGLAQGLNVKVVASMGSATGAKPSPTALEVAQRLLKSKAVRTTSDLRGRKIAVAGGSGAAGGYQLAATLREAGLTLKDVKVVNVPIPDMATALADGGVDAALAPAPFTTAMEQRGTAKPLAVPPRGTSATGVIFSGGFAGKPAADRFLAALRDAAGELQGSRATSEENLKILAKATGQKLEVLRRTPSYQWDPRLAVDENQLAAQRQTYLDSGLLRDGAAERG
ncbi:ABC transporter substrate-binding protein [Streptomyces sp. NPDC052040]|uniref:ABC transporter substrate-binding protein n=1 Tax=Streptomyces sp. NPDC052040 TaxID=3365682 RepID=UPI0037D3FEE2